MNWSAQNAVMRRINSVPGKSARKPRVLPVDPKDSRKNIRALASLDRSLVPAATTVLPVKVVSPEQAVRSIPSGMGGLWETVGFLINSNPCTITEAAPIRPVLLFCVQKRLLCPFRLLLQILQYRLVHFALWPLALFEVLGLNECCECFIHGLFIRSIVTQVPQLG